MDGIDLAEVIGSTIGKAVEIGSLKILFALQLSERFFKA
jgi:hypothetical protein